LGTSGAATGEGVVLRMVDDPHRCAPHVLPDGHCLFGPVLIEPLTGGPAVRLWDAMTAWVEDPHLCELQRPKTPADERRIVETLRPHVHTRDQICTDRGEVMTVPDGTDRGCPRWAESGVGVNTTLMAKSMVSWRSRWRVRSEL